MDSAVKNSEKQGTDFSLLLRSLERKILGGDKLEDVAETLSNEQLWKKLPAEHALRWARLAQMAGDVSLCLSILEWINEGTPDLKEAWDERLEVLSILDRREELVRVTALARARFAGEIKLHGAAVIEEEAAIAPAGLEAGSQESCTDSPTRQASDEPFLELRREETSLSLFMQIFQGRTDVFARQWVDAKSASQGYVPVRRPLLPADVRDHLRGKYTYGIYLMREDNTVLTGVIDVDLKQQLRRQNLSREEKQRVHSESRYLLRRLLELSAKASLPCVLEFSGGKGYHAWYPMETPVAASQVRKALLHIAGQIKTDLHCFDLEVFPKQDRLSGAGLGNPAHRWDFPLPSLLLSCCRKSATRKPLHPRGASQRKAKSFRWETWPGKRWKHSPRDSRLFFTLLSRACPKSLKTWTVYPLARWMMPRWRLESMLRGVARPCNSSTKPSATPRCFWTIGSDLTRTLYDGPAITAGLNPFPDMFFHQESVAGAATPSMAALVLEPGQAGRESG